MAGLTVERDIEILIDNQLTNLGWDNNPHSKSRNVFQQRVKTEKQKNNLVESDQTMFSIKLIQIDP